MAKLLVPSFRGFGRAILQTFLGFIVFGIFLLFLLIVLLPAAVVRFLVKISAKLLNPQLGKMVTTRGSFFTNIDNTYASPKMNVLSVLTLEGELGVQKARKLFTQGWIEREDLPELQQSLVKWAGFYFWKWGQFNIDNHINELDWRQKFGELNQAAITEINNDLLTKPYMDGTSPWEIWLLYNKLDSGSGSEPDGSSPVAQETVLILRTHHSLGDGKALLNLISYLCFESGNKFINKVEPSRPTQIGTHTIAKICRALALMVWGSYEQAGLLLEAGDKNDFILPVQNLSWKLKGGLSCDIPIQYIKAIAAHRNTTFTAILFTGIAGAVRKFMESNSLVIPVAMKCCSPYPIAGHTNRLRNYSSYCELKLPVGIPTLAARLQYIEQQFRNVKRSMYPLVSFYMMSYFGALFPWQTKVLAPQRPLSTHVSNIAGPIGPMDIVGHRLKSIWFGPANSGIGITCLSYNGNLRICAVVDKAVLPNHVDISDLIIRYALEEFEQLWKFGEGDGESLEEICLC